MSQPQTPDPLAPQTPQHTRLGHPHPHQLAGFLARTRTPQHFLHQLRDPGGDRPHLPPASPGGGPGSAHRMSVDASGSPLSDQSSGPRQLGSALALAHADPTDDSQLHPTTASAATQTPAARSAAPPGGPVPTSLPSIAAAIAASAGTPALSASDIGSPMSVGSADDMPVFHRLHRRQSSSVISARIHHSMSINTAMLATSYGASIRPGARRMSLDSQSGLHRTPIPGTPAPKSIHRILQELKQESRPFESEIEHERATNSVVGKAMAQPGSPMAASITPPEMAASPTAPEFDLFIHTPRTPIPVSHIKDPLVYVSHSSRLNPENNVGSHLGLA
nr:hypothetical protein HK105_000254 [Polyrhizophydium stewartii]